MVIWNNVRYRCLPYALVWFFSPWNRFAAGTISDRFRHKGGHRRNFSGWPCLALFCIAEAAANTPAVSYDMLVRQARAGNCKPILAWLQSQQAQRQLTRNEIADWLQITSWSGNDRQVLSIWQRYQHEALPDRAKISAAQAYRNLKYWQQALALLQQIGAPQSKDENLRSLYIMALADAQQNRLALSAAEQFVSDDPNVGSYLTLSYVQNAQGQSENAWQSASQAYSLDPGNRDAAATYLSRLGDSRIAAGAQRVAGTVPTSDEQRRQMALQQGAELVRDSLASGSDEASRFVAADEALNFYQKNIAAWQRQANSAGGIRAARIDRIGAYVARSKMQAAVQEYESLRRSGPVPNYAGNWAATAYLYLRQPAKAVAIWQKNLDIDDRDSVTGYFTALTENEQLTKAKTFSEHLAKRVPYRLGVYGLRTTIPNDQWLDVQNMSITVASNANNLAVAQRRAEKMAFTAPSNQSLAINLAGIYDQRGWPRKAEDVLKRSESLEPRNIELESQQGLVALDLQEWQQAELLADDVSNRTPENQSAQLLNRERNIHDKAELAVTGYKGIDSDSPVTGSHDFNTRILLYAPPIDNNWRFYTGAGYANSRFEEGAGIDRNQIVGVEYTDRNNWVASDVSHHNYGHGNKIGGQLAAWHDFGDDWRIGGSLEHLGDSTPLRAMKNGVFANTAAAYIRWRQDERRQLRLDISGSHFTDGNNRQEYILSGQQRLCSSAYWLLDFTPSISASHNTRTHVAYYSPRQDLAILPAVTVNNIMYRYYDVQWRQQFAMGAGEYWERNYGNKLISTVSYGQRLQLNKVFELGATLSWDKRPYDGEREKNISFSFDMDYRF